MRSATSRPMVSAVERPYASAVAAKSTAVTLPAARSEPQRVGAVAAAGVKGTSGTEPCELGRQMRIRRTLRDAIPVLAQGLRPALFPEVPVVLAHVG